MGRPECCRLACTCRALDDYELSAACQCAHDGRLVRVDAHQPTACRTNPLGRPLAPPRETTQDVVLDIKHLLRGQGPDVLGHVGRGEERGTPSNRSGGDVLGQFDPRRRLSDHVGLRNQDLDRAADVGQVPRRPLRRQLSERPIRRAVAVDPRHRCRLQRGWSSRVAVAEVPQLGVPPRHQIGAAGRGDLVRAGVGPRPPIPHLPQLRPGLLTGMLAPPLGLVTVDVPVDLTRPGAERPDIRGKLRDLPRGRVEREAVGGEHGPELRVGGHRSMADAVDRLDHVPRPHRVQTPPPPLGPHAGVDLQMKMPVRITCSRRVVPNHGCFDLLNRNLHLAAARPDPRRRVLPHPPDDLRRRPVLGRVQRIRHIRVQGRCE